MFRRSCVVLCRSCVAAKSPTANINRGSTRIDDPDTCFHTLAIGIWGPVNTPSIGNFSYLVPYFINLRLL